MSQQCNITINWLPLLSLSDIGKPGTDFLKTLGGVYLWIWKPLPGPSAPMVTYVGRTKSFAKRLDQEIADTVGYGGTYLELKPSDDDPVEAIKKEPRFGASYLSTCSRLRFRWNPSGEDQDEGLLAFLDKRIRGAVAYLKHIQVACGQLSVPSKAGDVEGGLIDHFATKQSILRWPGARTSIDYLIGRRSNRCRQPLLLKHYYKNAIVGELAGLALPDTLPGSDER